MSVFGQQAQLAQTKDVSIPHLWRKPHEKNPLEGPRCFAPDHLGTGTNPCSALQIKHDKDHCVPPLWPASQNQYCQRAQKHSGPIEHKDTQRGQPQAAPSIFWPHKMWFATLHTSSYGGWSHYTVPVRNIYHVDFVNCISLYLHAQLICGTGRGRDEIHLHPFSRFRTDTVLIQT